MKLTKVTCSCCIGTGSIKDWVMVSDKKFEVKESACEQCDGKGYMEYAVFSIEEAEAILKHCGLDKE